MRLTLLLAVLLGTTPAFAAGTDADVAEAKVHYDRGMTHYHLGEFSAAVDEFKAAYGLSQASPLLFNLGQAARLGHQYEQALHFYRTYLRLMPDASNRADVEQRITELEPLAAEERARIEARQKPLAPPPSAVVEAAPVKTVRQPGPSGRPLRIGGVALGAIGIGVLGAGAGLGGAALSAQSQLSKLARDMGTWSPSQSDLYHRGKTEATAATAMYVVGGAALATGLVLYLVGRHRDRTRFAVAPGPGGAQAVLWHDF
ncbi:MAG TPA: tetratricopeptide repeat protein [Polyangia bacterium]|jgi:tetratricopeptide (TPR) repeat protein|nr:tetratricopeptide repeat protein [Polyangia bacterium]